MTRATSVSEPDYGCVGPPRRVAVEKELINCQGRTPEATMASALYTDVKRKGDNSVFTRYCPPWSAARREGESVSMLGLNALSKGIVEPGAWSSIFEKLAPDKALCSKGVGIE